MPERVKSCGVLVYRDRPDCEFLLMRHRDRWDLPKGHVDDQESELECALRELEEETGIQRSDIRIDPAFRFTHEYLVVGRKSGQPSLKTLVVFLGKLLLDDVEIRPTEHPSYAWWRWSPPHQIQTQTIDPLLDAVDRFWQST